MNTQCHAIACTAPGDHESAVESPFQPYSYASLLAHAIIQDLCELARKFNWKGTQRESCQERAGQESL